VAEQKLSRSLIKGGASSPGSGSYITSDHPPTFDPPNFPYRLYSTYDHHKMTLAAGYVEFDPDGDVVLILQQVSEMSDACEGAVDNEAAAEYEPGEAAIEGAEEANSVEEGSHDDEGSPDQARETDRLLPMRVCRPSPSSESAHSIASSKVRMRVSSRHLILVSNVFKSLLQGKFAESQCLSSTSAVEIELPDDDP
jgi:hypothetical protein